MSKKLGILRSIGAEFVADTLGTAAAAATPVPVVDAAVGFGVRHAVKKGLCGGSDPSC